MVPEATAIPTAALSLPPTPTRQDVLRGGMDANTLMHALRRRWLLALCMGTVVAAGSAIAMWFAFPESSSATALFEVASKDPSILRINVSISY